MSENIKTESEVANIGKYVLHAVCISWVVHTGTYWRMYGNGMKSSHHWTNLKWLLLKNKDKVRLAANRVALTIYYNKVFSCASCKDHRPKAPLHVEKLWWGKNCTVLDNFLPRLERTHTHSCWMFHGALQRNKAVRSAFHFAAVRCLNCKVETT